MVPICTNKSTYFMKIFEILNQMRIKAKFAFYPLPTLEDTDLWTLGCLWSKIAFFKWAWQIGNWCHAHGLS